MEHLDLVSYEKERDFREEISLSNEYTIIGCGGVGWWAAIFLAMMGVRKLILIDADKIEATNLNRLSCPQTWLGIPKAIALRRIIHFLRPLCAVSVFTCNITEAEFELLSSIRNNSTPIIDATDDARIQVKLSDYCREHTCRYIKIGYEGFKVGSYSDMSAWLPEDYSPGYRTTSANAVSSAMAAGFGLLNLFISNRDLEINLKDLVIRRKNNA